MIFAFWLTDSPGTAHLRVEVRPAHLEYLGKMAEQIAFAGPLTSEDGKTVVGSLLAIDFPSRSEAEAWIAAEPFMKAGAYEKSAIQVFNNRWPQKAGFPSA